MGVFVGRERMAGRTLLVLGLLALVGGGAAFAAPGLSLRRVSPLPAGNSRRSKTASISMQVHCVLIAP